MLSHESLIYSSNVDFVLNSGRKRLPTLLILSFKPTHELYEQLEVHITFFPICRPTRPTQLYKVTLADNLKKQKKTCFSDKCSWFYRADKYPFFLK